MFRRWLLAIAVVLMTVSCAGVGGRNVMIDVEKSSYNKELLKRFADYWKNRMENNVGKSRKYEAPYIQYAVSLKDYANYVNFFSEKNGTKIGKVIAHKVGCEKEYNCSVNYKIVFEVGGKQGAGEEKAGEGEDIWVNVDGKWYHTIYNPILFPYVD